MDASKTSSKEPLWYKDAIIYEAHVRSFFDSNADGIGDFPGLIEKLDYLADLGVTAIWLLPFYPSPLKDGGYDIADYYSIDSNYGTMKDWRNFLREAHRRGLRVITELVLNHTSDQHTWFQRARRAPPGSEWRNYYVWTDNPEKYKQARVIFNDFELSNWTWDPVAGAYYWHRFYSHQPDLNYDSPETRKAIFKVIDFWLDQGVDGFRLDAIPYLYERENTSCESLPETHQFLKDLRRHVDEQYGDRVLLAEANQWPEEAVTYFGQGTGDECHMAFHFPLMPRLFMGVRMEDRVPIVDIFEQTPALPATSQWALFLRNHDELTLEMVTDEERDYMYRVYAQDRKARLNLGIRRRLAPLMGNDRKRIELLNLLLLSMPGTPVLYYGDEIGMGDNIYLGDRFGVRTPMHWNSDKNAGFSRANPQALSLPVVVDSEYHYETVNVEAQQKNANSLLWWTKRVINLRKQWKAFGRGTLEFLPTANRRVLAFLRHYEDETLLIVANLSRLPQSVELNIPTLAGQRPIELFGHTEFPIISTAPYVLTFSPYGAFWFCLRQERKQAAEKIAARRELVVNQDWREALAPGAEQRLWELLRPFLEQQPWFYGRGRAIEGIKLQDVIDLGPVPGGGCLAFLQVSYSPGEYEIYLLPLSFAPGVTLAEPGEIAPEFLIAEVHSQNGTGVLFDGLGSSAFVDRLLNPTETSEVLHGRHGEFYLWKAEPALQKTAVENRLVFNRSNTSLVLQNNLFLKFFRKLEPGINPEVELESHLAEKGFANVPALVGKMEYHSREGDMTIGALSEIVPDGKNAWVFTLEALSRYFDRVQTRSPADLAALRPSKALVRSALAESPAGVAEVIGTYPEGARLIGQRTGELHRALVSPEPREFTADSFTPYYLRSLYQSIRNRVVESLDQLQNQLSSLPEETRAKGVELLRHKTETLSRLQALFRNSPHGVRIRCHGNFHISEVLYTGKDFFFIDFEGDVARPMSMRRIKRAPVYDLAKMIRSFHYAAHAALEKQVESGALVREKLGQMTPWAEIWRYWVSASFLKGYWHAIGPDHVLTQSVSDFDLLLNCHLIDRAAAELLDELRRRPLLAAVSMEGWLRTLKFWGL